jgi:RNA polymerase sigma-70 factor (ECF subfamily)
MTPDSSLIQQVQQGNTDAFEQLMRKYQEQIFRISRSIVKNPQDAEDIVQDTFLQAYLKLNQLRHPDDFSSWLQKIAVNLSKNHKSRNVPEGITFEELTEEHQMLTTPEEIILRKELIDAILKSIEMLPMEDRKVVKAHIDGLSHKVISDNFGISYQASMSRLSHARKRLSKHISRLMYSFFSFDFLKKINLGGILAMKIGASSKIIIIAVGVLLILSAGYVSYTKLIMPSSSQSANETNSISDVSQGKSIATQDSKGQQNLSKTSVLKSSAEHQKTDHTLSDKSVDQSSGENILAGKSRSSQANASAQSGSGQTYDVRYDSLIEIAKKIEPLAQEIKTTLDEYNKLRNEVDSISRLKSKDPKNLSAEDKDKFASLMEKQGNLNVELSNLYSSIETLIPGSLRTKVEGMTLSPEGDQIEEPVPGSSRTEVEGARRGTIATASIDYDRIRSVLGSVPAQQETYLSNLFSSLPEVYYINSEGSR